LVCEFGVADVLKPLYKAYTYGEMSGLYASDVTLPLMNGVVTVFTGTAFAAEGESEGGVIITSNGTEIQTSKGMEAPELDYTFVWWTFILTFGLLFIYYVVVLRISDKEFKKIVDAHFGPRHEER
jgi:hypothetical protein